MPLFLCSPIHFSCDTIDFPMQKNGQKLCDCAYYVYLCRTKHTKLQISMDEKTCIVDEEGGKTDGRKFVIISQ